MAYTTFSTDNTDYVLQLGIHHIEGNKQVDIFNGIDALVIETGIFKLNHDKINYFTQDPQYKLPLNLCSINDTPVFSTDVRPSSVGFSRDYFSYITTSIPSLISLILARSQALSEREVNNFILRLCSNYFYLIQEPINEGRNALNARKIEEFVSPLMTERLGRKPYIGMIYGAAHMGLKSDLQSKRRRDFTIWNWRDFNFGKFAGFVKEDLNTVQEAFHDGRTWTFTDHKIDLF